MFNLFAKKVELSTESIYLYNSATNSKDVLETLKPGQVKMYSCGPTVYDNVHIGNLRAFLMADVLRRVLEFNGYEVENTMNFTDFGHLTDDGDAGEDKMMKGLKRDGQEISLAAMKKMADRYIDLFKDDAESMRFLEPRHWTRASEYVTQQVNLIKTLEEKGYAYETSDGLYFDISKFPTYGVLGNIDVNKMKDGARVEINPEKKHPADFALWKKGELGWDSTWGKGFPGWHIECSAMAMATLGKQIDIHTGGEDNKYTHHNAEIAQTESVTGKQFARYWLHSAFMQIENTKIAKSLGNGITLKNLKDRGFSGADYRYWLLTSHYRTNVNFTFEALEASKKALFRLKRHLFEEYKNAKGVVNQDYYNKFLKAINDDLDTPKAIAIIWDLVKDTNVAAGNKVTTIKKFDDVLGLGLTEKVEDIIRELGVIDMDQVPQVVQDLINEREVARVVRNWDEADRLREAINLQGYLVEDTPEGPKVSHI